MYACSPAERYTSCSVFVCPEKYKRVFNNNKIFPDLSKIIIDILNLNNNEIYSDKSFYYYKTILKINKKHATLIKSIIEKKNLTFVR